MPDEYKSCVATESEQFQQLLSVHISGTPIPCYPMGRPDVSWANERCNGNGKRDYKRPMQLYILR